MDKIFKEQLVKKENLLKYIIMRIIAFLFVGLSTVLAVLFIPNFAVYIFVFFTALAVFLCIQLNVEFEYSVSGDKFFIATIRNKSKRYETLSFNINSIYHLTNISGDFSNEKFGKYDQTKNFSSGKIKKNSFAFLLKKNEKIIKVIIEPDKIILDELKKYKVY